MSSVSANAQPVEPCVNSNTTSKVASNGTMNHKKQHQRGSQKHGKKHSGNVAPSPATKIPDEPEVPWPQNGVGSVRFPKRFSSYVRGKSAVQFGTLQHGPQQKPQQPPVAYGKGTIGYNKYLNNQHFQQQRMHVYSAGYPVSGPGYMPPQSHMPMQGWVPALPPQQFSYMPISQSGRYPYYYTGSSDVVMHGTYGMPSTAAHPMYTTASPTNFVGAMSEASAPNVAAQPVSKQKSKNLSASAQPFVPGQLSNQKSASGLPKTELTASNPVVTSKPAKSAAKTDTSNPLFKIPAKRVIQIVNPNEPKPEPEADAKTDSTPAESVEEKLLLVEATYAAKVKETPEVSNQEDSETNNLSSQAEASVPHNDQNLDDDVKNATDSASITVPADAADEAKCNGKNVHPDTEVMPIEDVKPEEAAEKPELPSISQSSSRQVTFSEPTESSAKVLQAEEVASLYADSASPPRIIEEILRYPPGFLLQFAGLCKPPPGLDFKVIPTQSHDSEHDLKMRRSASEASQQRGIGSAESIFGNMGRFRRSHTETSIGWPSESSSASDSKWRIGNRLGRRTPSGHTGEQSGERTSRRGHGQSSGPRHGSSNAHPQSEHIEPLLVVKPLEKSASRFVPRALRKDGDVAEDEMDEKVFRRRIIALLNKLTPDNINVVSDDLIAWGDKSAQETDGRILRTLIELVVDKAVDEPKWIKAYTELCLRIISKTSDSVKDHNLRMVNGEYPSGGHLARKYLLQKCQGDFERGWKVTMPEAKQTDEFYEAVKIKRRGLGLVEFIGELYIADVLTVDIIKSCLRRLLSNIKTPEDEVLQSMMKLLATVGKKMDVPANKDEMDLYFSRIRSMTTNDSLDSRVRMLLMNSMELRQRKWQGRDSQEAPQTIAQLHEELERQKIALANAKRLDAQSRWHKDSDSRRGRYGTVGRSSESGRNSEIQSAGDLSRFGNLSRSKQQSAGSTSPGNPFSAFAGGSRGWRDSSSGVNTKKDAEPRLPMLNTSRTPSHSSRSSNSRTATPDALSSRNMFDALMDEDESPECASTKEQLTSEEIRAKVKAAIDECISQQSDTQLVAAFKGIGETNYRTALSQTVDTIMDRRPDQVEQALGAVSALAKHNLLTEDAMTAVFAEYSDQLEDLVMDVPHALKFFGMLMAACGIPIARVSESLGKLATKVDVLRPPAMSVVSAYLKHAIKTDGEAQTQKAVEDAGFDVAQYLCADYRSDADIKKTLALQDLLCLFPKYA